MDTRDLEYRIEDLSREVERLRHELDEERDTHRAAIDEIWERLNEVWPST